MMRIVSFTIHGTCHVQGDTIFAPLEEVVNSLPADQRERWERLHMLSDRRGGVAQPLIYPHPITGMLPACLCKPPPPSTSWVGCSEWGLLDRTFAHPALGVIVVVSACNGCSILSCVCVYTREAAVVMHQ